jgi:hypothetical protein
MAIPEDRFGTVRDDLIDKLADTSSAALRGESWFPQPLMKHDSLFGRLFECHAAESTGLH